MNFTSHVNVDEGPPNGPEKQPPRFQSEFKTNVKEEEQLEHQKPGPSSLLQPKAESVSTAPLFHKKEDPAPLPPYNHASGRKDNQEARAEAEPMDIGLEEEGDYVLREIDVYFKPSLSDESAQLYVMQYPLRPYWRPYEGFREVRVKPQWSEIEVDLEINVSEDNYDPQSEDLQCEKQTLSSNRAPVTGYAIGLLKKNKLFLNPVDSVVQLRPSMAYLNKGSHLEKKNIRNQGTAFKGKMRTDASDKDLDEAWTSLEYHGTESTISSEYRQKMMSDEGSNIEFNMSPSAYLNSMCPATSTDLKDKGPSKRILLSLPIEDRFKRLFSEGPQVHRFQALMHLAPASSEEDVLKYLKEFAVLVQGLWVAKSSLLGLDRIQQLARDYILFLFTQNQIISNRKLKQSVKIPYENLKNALLSLAVKRTAFDDWKFKEPADELFKKKYPHVLKDQERVWSDHGKQIMHLALRGGKIMPSVNSVKPVSTDVAVTNNRSVKEIVEGIPGSNVTKTMSEETLEALPKALEKIFNDYKVCSLQLICQTLRDMAVSKAKLPKSHSRVALAASLAASAPPSELRAVVQQVAVEIHGVYVQKPQGSTDLDLLRQAIIKLFSLKEPNAKLKKADICAAAKIILERDITTPEYNKVINEFCVSNKGGWMLKSGDGSSK